MMCAAFYTFIVAKRIVPPSSRRTLPMTSSLAIALPACEPFTSEHAMAVRGVCSRGSISTERTLRLKVKGDRDRLLFVLGPLYHIERRTIGNAVQSTQRIASPLFMYPPVLNGIVSHIERARMMSSVQAYQAAR
jgi:hypothetical protein